MDNMVGGPPPEPRSSRFGGYAIHFTRSETMEQVFGSQPITPGQMMKRLWDYIKRHGLATAQAPPVPSAHGEYCQCVVCRHERKVLQSRPPRHAKRKL